MVRIHLFLGFWMTVESIGTISKHTAPQQAHASSEPTGVVKAEALGRETNEDDPTVNSVTWHP